MIVIYLLQKIHLCLFCFPSSKALQYGHLPHSGPKLKNGTMHLPFRLIEDAHVQMQREGLLQSEDAFACMVHVSVNK